MPKRGLEPPRPDGHYTLNVARLPIPPLRHVRSSLASQSRKPPKTNVARVTVCHLAIRKNSCQATPPFAFGGIWRRGLALLIFVRLG